MKRQQLFFASILLFTIAACNSETEKNGMAVNNLKTYVDSVNNTSISYTRASWDKLSEGYQERSSQVNEEELTEEQKKEYEATQKKYDAIKTKYEAAISKQDAEINSKRKLRAALFGEGKPGDDMNFSFVTAGNILSVYQQFADVVQANKKVYSREDWDEVKLLYEALDTRKNEVEKDLASKDNFKIAKEKIKISTIFATRRPLAKAEENADAKK
jgi:hypothetical protein